MIKKKCLPLLVIFALLIALACGCKQKQGKELKLPLPWDEVVDFELVKVLQAPEGTIVNCELLKGKVVVLEFWATWCGPCRQAIPHLNKVAKECKNDPIQFIAITVEDEGTIKDFLRENPINAWIGIDSKSDIKIVGKTAKSFGVMSIPHAVIIEQHGFVVCHTHPSLISREGLLNLMKACSYPSPTQ